MNRAELLKHWQKANSSKDMDKAYELYCQILSEPGLSLKLSQNEILDIRFNRAINNTEIANWFYEKRQYTRAHTHMEEAYADADACVKGYKKLSDLKKAQSLLKECTENLEACIDHLKKQAAELPALII